VTFSPTTAGPTMSPTTPLDPPRIDVPAQFSDSLAQIYVTFSEDTDTPDVPCSTLIAATSLSKLGAAPNCVWATSTRLVIELGEGWTATLSDMVTVNAGVIRDASGHSGYMIESTIGIIGPANPVTVTAVLTAPEIVGSCNKFSIHSGLSRGNAGKPLAYNWSYVSGVPMSANFVQYVQNATGQGIELDSMNLTMGRHTFAVTVTNWLGISAYASANVTKTSTEAPTVTFSSGAEYSIDPSSAVRITAQIQYFQCSGAQLQGVSTSGVWRQAFVGNNYLSTSVPNVGSLTSSPVTIQNPTSLALYLPPNSLTAGSYYGFIFRARAYNALQQILGEVNSTLVVYATMPDVVALIDGGTFRTVSVNNSVIIDASSSYDPIAPNTALSFFWTVNKELSNGTLGPAMAGFASVVSSSLTIPSTLLQANAFYQIRVTVTGLSNNGPARESVAMQRVETVLVTIPLVSINLKNYAETKKVDPASKVIIEGSASNTSGTTLSYAWSCTSKNFDLLKPQNLRSGTNSTAIVIAANSLTGGVTYSFQISVTTAMGATGRAAIELTANTAPSLGTCLSNPISGYALKDIFRFECTDWTDEDLPLKYKFQIVSVQLTTNETTDLTGLREVNFFETMLPLPLYTITQHVHVIIADNLGASATTDITLNVIEEPAFNLSITQQQMDQSLAVKDIQTYSVFLTGVATYLKKSSQNLTTTAVDLPQIQSSRLSLVNSIDNLLLSSDGSPEESIEIPAALVREATDYANGREIENSTRFKALDIIEKITTSSLNKFDDGVVSSTVTAMGNVLGSAVDSAAPAQELKNVTDKVLFLLDKLTEGVLVNSVVGEVATEMSSSKISLVSQLVDPVTSNIVKSSTGAQATLPNDLLDSFGAASSSSLAVSLGLIKSNPYPSSFTTTGLLVLNVKDSQGVAIGTSGTLSTPIQFLIPAANVGSQFCRYWDASTETWSISGVSTMHQNADGQWCGTDHLTAFSIAQFAPTNAPSAMPTATPITSTPTINGETFSPATSSPVTFAPTETPPEPILAQIRSSLVGIQVDFNAPTARPSVGCSGLLDPATFRKLGANPLCEWIDRLTLMVQFGQDPTILPGESFIILGNVVLTVNGDPGLAVPTTLTLQAPSSSTPVSIDIIGPTSLGICGFATISTSTTGSGGRSMTFKWTYAPISVSGSTASLSSLVHSTNTSSLTLFPSQLPAGSHNFTVEARNWIGSTATAHWILEKADSLIPKVESAAPVLNSADRNLELSVLVRVTLPACNDTSQTSGLTTVGAWTQVFSSSDHVAPSAQAYKSTFTSDVVIIPNPNSMTLKLPADTLRMGFRYGFNFKGLLRDVNGNNVGESNATFVFDVQTKPVEAIIAGGSGTRMAPVLSTESFIVKFDGSGSFDPANQTANLIYQWKVQDSFNREVSIPASETASSILLLNTTRLQADITYLVTLTVTGQQIGGVVRSASSSQNLATVSIEIPIVFIASEVGERVNAGERFPVAAEVQNFNYDEVTFAWSCTTENLDLTNPANLLTTNTESNLVIASGVLSQGVTYTFAVTVTAIATGSFGKAVFTFQTNAAPALGSCTADPPAGDAILTTFRLACDKWTDPEGDIPLQYKFQADTSGVGSFIDLSELQSLNFFETILPAPKSAASNNAVNLVSVISDSVGATVTYPFTAIVNARTIDVTAAVDDVDSLVTKGDLATSGVILTGAIDQISTDTALPSTSSSVEQQARAKVVQSLDSYVGTATSITSNANKLATPSVLLNQATASTNPGGVTAEASLQALSISDLIINSTGFGASALPIEIVGTLGNLITASKGRQNSTDQLHTATAAGRASANIGSALLSAALPGERPSEVGSGNLTITSRRLSSRGLASGLQSLSTGAAVNLSSSLNFSTSNVDLVTTFSTDPTFPGNTSAGIYSIDIRLAGSTNSESVSNLSNPISFVIPAPEEVNSCVYWNSTLQKYANDGLRFIGRTTTATGDPAILCETTHLTDFSGEVQINVNTISAEDINAKSFSITNPVMAICLGIFMLYIVLSYFAIRKDLRHQSPEDSTKFWRQMNKMGSLEDHGIRSWKNVCQTAEWKFRTQHAWLSPMIRYPGDYLNSWKRVTILFTLLFNQLLVAALLVGQEQKLPLLSGVVAASVVTTLFSLPVPILLSVLLGRNAPELLQLVSPEFFLLTCLCVLCGCRKKTEEEEEEEIEIKSPKNDLINATQVHIQPLDDADADLAMDMAVPEGMDEPNETKREEVKKKRKVYTADLVQYEFEGNDIKLVNHEEEGSVTETMKKKIFEIMHIPAENVQDVDLNLSAENVIQGEVLPDENEAKKLCCGIYARPVYNHHTSVKDVVVLTFFIIFMLGAWFILAALSLNPTFDALSTVLASMLVFFQNFFLQCLTPIILQLFLFAPLPSCLKRIFGKDANSEIRNHGITVLFEPGILGFEYQRLKVVRVFPETQAARKGIKVGWRITGVEEYEAENDRHLFELLQEEHRISTTPFAVKFVPKYVRAHEEEEVEVRSVHHVMESPTDWAKGNDVRSGIENKAESPIGSQAVSPRSGLRSTQDIALYPMRDMSRKILTRQSPGSHASIYGSRMFVSQNLKSDMSLFSDVGQRRKIGASLHQLSGVVLGPQRQTRRARVGTIHNPGDEYIGNVSPLPIATVIGDKKALEDESSTIRWARSPKSPESRDIFGSPTANSTSNIPAAAVTYGASRRMQISSGDAERKDNLQGVVGTKERKDLAKPTGVQLQNVPEQPGKESSAGTLMVSQTALSRNKPQENDAGSAFNTLGSSLSSHTLPPESLRLSEKRHTRRPSHDNDDLSLLEDRAMSSVEEKQAPVLKGQVEMTPESCGKGSSVKETIKKSTIPPDIPQAKSQVFAFKTFGNSLSTQGLPHVNEDKVPPQTEILNRGNRTKDINRGALDHKEVEDTKKSDRVLGIWASEEAADVAKDQEDEEDEGRIDALWKV